MNYFYENFLFMQKISIACILLLFIVGCKPKTKSLKGNEKVEFQEMVNAFPELKLSYKTIDSSVYKIADTTTIGYFVMNQFVPDSVMEKISKNDSAHFEIHPVGKIIKGEEKYLLANVSVKNRISLTAFLFHEKTNAFLSSLELLKNKYSDGYRHELHITSEPTFIMTRQKLGKDKELLYTRNGYAYNSGIKDFMKVMNDSNEETDKDTIINPIDTLPRLFKFSGDYVKNKRNFISIRDGSKEGRYIFFIHFENSDDCSGELKGVFNMRDEVHGFYSETNDICVIDFTFERKRVKVKEQNNCGKHRGIQCYFNDTYTLKKESKK